MEAIAATVVVEVTAPTKCQPGGSRPSTTTSLSICSCSMIRGYGSLLSPPFSRVNRLACMQCRSQRSSFSFLFFCFFSFFEGGGLSVEVLGWVLIVVIWESVAVQCRCACSRDVQFWSGICWIEGAGPNRAWPGVDTLLEPTPLQHRWGWHRCACSVCCVLSISACLAVPSAQPVVFVPAVIPLMTSEPGFVYLYTRRWSSFFILRRDLSHDDKDDTMSILGTDSVCGCSVHSCLWRLFRHMKRQRGAWCGGEMYRGVQHAMQCVPVTRNGKNTLKSLRQAHAGPCPHHAPR